MKERKQTREDVINEFLKDEEVKNLIRSLAHIADERGLNVSNLNAAITMVWKEEIPNHSNEKIPLTKEQRQYMAKVDNFVRYYKKDLLANYKEAVYLGHGVSIGLISDEETFFEILKEGLVTLYIVFCNEERMPKKTVETYLKKYFGNHCDSEYLKSPLIDFFDGLKFDKNNSEEKPKYERYHNFEIALQKGFEEFSKKYFYRRRSFSEAAIKSIWFISTYF